MIFKTGLIEFGKRDWDRWVFQITHPTIAHDKEFGFRLTFDLLAVRFDPYNNGYGLVLFGFGFAAQKGRSKPSE